MKKFLLLASFVVLAAVCPGAPAQRLYLLTEPKGWKSFEYMEDGRPAPFPTIGYKPADGRNAQVLISQVGKSPRISDLRSLRAVHAMGIQGSFKMAPGQYETQLIKLPHGQALATVFEDPKLIGKPPVRDDFKFSTTVDILFDSGEIAHATLFADERTGPTATEEMQILQSCDLHPAASAPGNSGSQYEGIYNPVIVPGLDAILCIPKDGLQEASLNPNGGENYFSFIRDDGMDISGWIEPVEKYGGFRKVWSADKGKMERGMGARIQNETFMTINGWEAVFYVLKMGKVEQPNLRACRIAGNTWLDVHLSTMTKQGSTAALKAMLESFRVQMPPVPAGAAPPPATRPHF